VSGKREEGRGGQRVSRAVRVKKGTGDVKSHEGGDVTEQKEFLQVST
jgi:hypothetical protein